LPAQDSSRRWTVIGSGLLIASMAVVVIYTTRRAFFSPITLVVVAAIGLVAVLLQLRFRRDVAQKVQLTMWLNIAGVAIALVALFADLLRLSWLVFHVTALVAVGCFSISSVVILEALRRNRVVSR
jgi:putative effector of murein hydrolase